jgi:hypothetical protein
MQVASEKVAKISNLFFENFFVKEFSEEDGNILDKEKMLIIKPIKGFDILYLEHIEGNNGGKIENPIPLNRYIINKIFVFLIFINLFLNILLK